MTGSWKILFGVLESPGKNLEFILGKTVRTLLHRRFLASLLDGGAKRHFALAPLLNMPSRESELCIKTLTSP